MRPMMMTMISLCVGRKMRIVDSVVLQKGMVSWEQSGSLLHKLRFIGDPIEWAPRDAKELASMLRYCPVA
jgi:hypothetical protein